MYESKSFFHAIGNKQKLVRELLGIQIILFNIEARGRGGRIANRVKAMSAIKVHLIHGPWMKRRDDDMLNKKARNFEASWQTHPCHEMSSTMSRRQTHRKCCNKTWACPPSGPSWDPPGNQLGWTTCLILVFGSPRWHRRGHGHTGVGRTSTLGVALVSDFFWWHNKVWPAAEEQDPIALWQDTT